MLFEKALHEQELHAILRSLDFGSRGDRQSTVENTYTQTFDWVFDDSHGSIQLSIGFRDWLQSGSSTFGYLGRPGLESQH